LVMSTEVWAISETVLTVIARTVGVLNFTSIRNRHAENVGHAIFAQAVAIMR
jgi:hypothetical protein